MVLVNRRLGRMITTKDRPKSTDVSCSYSPSIYHPVNTVFLPPGPPHPPTCSFQSSFFNPVPPFPVPRSPSSTDFPVCLLTRPYIYHICIKNRIPYIYHTIISHPPYATLPNPKERANSRLAKASNVHYSNVHLRYVPSLLRHTEFQFPSLPQPRPRGPAPSLCTTSISRVPDGKEAQKRRVSSLIIRLFLDRRGLVACRDVSEVLESVNRLYCSCF